MDRLPQLRRTASLAYIRKAKDPQRLRWSCAATSRRCREIGYKIGVPRGVLVSGDLQQRLARSTAAATWATAAAFKPCRTKATAARPRWKSRCRRCRRWCSSRGGSASNTTTTFLSRRADFVCSHVVCIGSAVWPHMTWSGSRTQSTFGRLEHFGESHVACGPHTKWPRVIAADAVPPIIGLAEEVPCVAAWPAELEVLGHRTT